MPTLEERVQALEQEVTARRQTEEMLTVAIRALVSKEAFEQLQRTVKEAQEQNGKLFNVIIGQNSLHNERVKDLPAQLAIHDNKITELDGKVVGLQTEMRQHFTDLDGKVIGLQTEARQFQTETRQRFTEIETALTQILARLPEKPQH